MITKTGIKVRLVTVLARTVKTSQSKIVLQDRVSLCSPDCRHTFFFTADFNKHSTSPLAHHSLEVVEK